VLSRETAPGFGGVGAGAVAARGAPSFSSQRPGSAPTPTAYFPFR
jgi:hypothetical protein